MLWLKEAFSDRRYEIHQVIGEGDTVVVHCTFSGRHTGEFMGIAPTNRPFAFRQVHIVRLRTARASSTGPSVTTWACCASSAPPRRGAWPAGGRAGRSRG
jgi:predicted ester cyclase